MSTRCQVTRQPILPLHNMSTVPLDKRTKLNLGSGRKPLPDYVNVDIVASVGPDLVHNLEVVPYPFPDNRFELIAAYDVVEHVTNITGFMSEIWRIGKPGATVEFTTPHFSCRNSFTDPTHVRHMSTASMDYFTKGNPLNFYGSEGFVVERADIIFGGGMLNRIGRLAYRLSPQTYECRLAWIIPAWFIYFRLRVAK